MRKITTFIAFLLSGLIVQAQANLDSFVVKPYLQFATQNSIYVLWETSANATSVVEYGEALFQASRPNLNKKVSLPGTRLLHEVKLDSLKTATKYLYRVRTTTSRGQEIVGEIYTFNTAVQENDAIFFSFIGDTQRNNRTPWAWGKIAQRIWEERPHFVVHAGDVVDLGTSKSDWVDHFFPAGHIVMSRFPVYTVLGNHEQDAQYYYDYMVNPAPEYYYTFTYGNAQFFMMDTNRDVSEGSEQYEWLEWELAKSTATWKFVVHHHPPYTSDSDDYGNTQVAVSAQGEINARNLVPLYEKYGVDFCLFGHIHVYERTWPILNNAINQKNGVIYINSGGAGGGLEDFDPVRTWFSLEKQRTHHYTTFAIYDKTVVFKAIDHDGHLFDSFEMAKNDDKNTDKQGALTQPPAPHFVVDAPIFQQQTQMQLLASSPQLRIVYTTDGSEPNAQSTVYTRPLTIQQSCTVKARAYTSEGFASRMVSYPVVKMAPMPPVKVGKLKPGLRWAYYEGSWDSLPDFSALSPLKKGVMTTISEKNVPARDDEFGIVLEGYVNIPQTDTYKFYTRTDDGSQLFIDGQLVVDNNGSHAANYKYGSTILEKGYHRIKMLYFESHGSQMMKAGFWSKETGLTPFHADMLMHEE